MGQFVKKTKVRKISKRKMVILIISITALTIAYITTYDGVNATIEEFVNLVIRLLSFII